MSANVAIATETLLSPGVQALFAQQGVAQPMAGEIDEILYGAGIHPQISADAAALLREAADITPFTDNARIYKRGSAPERLAFYALSRLLDPAGDAARKQLLADLPREAGSPFDGLTLSRKTGIHLICPRGWEPLEDVIKEAQAGFKLSKGQEGEVNPGKTFMTTGKLPGPFFSSAALRLARDPSILRCVGEYLDGFPTLFRINLLRSSNEYIQDGSSQFFHIDPEDWRQMKIFILINDVDEDGGPLHLLSAEATDEYRVKTGYRHGRLQDEEVFSRVGSDRLVQCVGPQGTMAFGDTSRCLHFGSRTGKRERFIVMVQYLTPFAHSFPLIPEQIKAKYSEPYKQLCAAQGVEPADDELRLFGAIR